MIGIVVGVSIHAAVQMTTSEIIRRQRLRLLNKWAAGQMTIVELEELKRKPWFQRAFPRKEVDPEKKNN